ncbi:hypothetical protein [Nioella aestuarii]|uniref:hypothetical protein n=1 Tax=Nioella aestuarii TaxID=1662864 RepID=UPI003D7F4A04
MSDPTGPEDRADTARLKAILLVCAALAFAVAPLMSEPFTGWSPEDFPRDALPQPLQPAGYAFSIWGVIYAWLVLHAGFGLIRRDTDEGWDAMRWPLFLSLAIGTGWIGVALTSPIMATLFIFVMLVGAVVAMLRAPKSRDGWLTAGPVGLYAGWLTAAASVAGATSLAGYSVITPDTASYLGLGVVILIGGTLATRHPPITYYVALAWALIGTAISNATSPQGDVVFTGAIVLALAGLLLAMIRQVRSEG